MLTWNRDKETKAYTEESRRFVITPNPGRHGFTLQDFGVGQMSTSYATTYPCKGSLAVCKAFAEDTLSKERSAADMENEVNARKQINNPDNYSEPDDMENEVNKLADAEAAADNEALDMENEVNRDKLRPAPLSAEERAIVEKALAAPVVEAPVVVINDTRTTVRSDRPFASAVGMRQSHAKMMLTRPLFPRVMTIRN